MTDIYSNKHLILLIQVQAYIRTYIQYIIYEHTCAVHLHCKRLYSQHQYEVGHAYVLL